MINYLKFLWKKCFGGMGNYRIKNTPTDLPVLIVTSEPLHCKLHSRFKKSCAACQEVIQ